LSAAAGIASFAGGGDRQDFAAQENLQWVGLEMSVQTFMPRSAGIG
jgi:hypothetical protein